MGVLTDFVVVVRSEAERVCNSQCPSREFSGIDAKGIDHVKLGKLYALLTDTKFDPGFVGGMSCLASRSEEGPWVYEVPTKLVQRVSQLDAPQLAAAAVKWAQTEEFSLDRWPADAVHTVLAELASLCVRAAAERKSVLMWMCL